MTQEEIIQLIDQRIQIAMNRGTHLIASKPIQILDGRNIQLGLTSGTKIGTGATQKLGFYGVTPIVQQATIAAASGGATVDASARAVIINLIAALKNVGITQ